MLNGLAETILFERWMLETAVENSVDDAWVVHFYSAFIAFGSILDGSDHGFIHSMSFRNIIVVSSFKRISFWWQFFWSFPIGSIDDENIFDIEVVGIYFIPVLLVLFMQIPFYQFNLVLGVDEVDGPLRAVPGLFDSC